MRRNDSEVLAELDRWQLTGLLLAVLVLAALAFFAGVLVGKKSSPPAPTVAVPNFVMPAPTAPAAATPADRQLALAGVAPGTTLIDRGLARPVADPAPDDPTDAARIATHRQLQEARAAKLRQLGPMAVASADDVPVQGGQVEGAPAGASGAGGYTLQVSAFGSKAAADAVAGELRQAGQAVRIRDLSMRGKPLFRVEVGQFASLQSAQAFQLKFERDSGYSGVLVPLR